MRIVAISCVKNELDIIEAFVRHTLAKVDRLLVLDNGSSDGTRQVLGRLVDEGLPLEIVDDPSPGHYQSKRMTRLLCQAARPEQAADWILPIDADEFLCGVDLKTFLRTSATAYEPVALRLKTYVPDPSDDPSESNPVRRIRYRRCKNARGGFKVAVPATLAREPGVRLDQGNHYILRDTVRVEPLHQHKVFLAHYPGRTSDQFAFKACRNYLQYLTMPERAPSWGSHYAPLLALLRRGPQQFEAGFRQLIIEYGRPANDPFGSDLKLDPLDYVGGALRYLPAGSATHLVPGLMNAAEELALHCARLTSRQRELEAEVAKLTSELALSEASARSRECELKAAVARLTSALTERTAVVHTLEHDAQAVRRSRSFRLGRTFLAPLRWLKRLPRMATSSVAS